MEPIHLVIIGASEIAYRRFLPALSKDPRFHYVGVAIEREQDEEKAKLFQRDFGGQIIHGYLNAIRMAEVQAVYVPQPPALHFQFGKAVLEAGKHLFMEKPFTTSLEDSLTLLGLAQEKGLAVIENYMFRFHKQITSFIELSKQQELIGDLQSYEVRFSFPQRATNDFRYMKALGGGALFDCGGYTIMLSNILLGGQGKIAEFKPVYKPEFEVDIEGMGTMKSENGPLCRFSFGMANPYCCYAKAYGSKGVLVAPRVLTAPFDFDVRFELYDSNNELIREIEIGEDDTFLKSIHNFYNCIADAACRKDNFERIRKQAILIEDTMKLGGMK